jgi:hypothetical protein
LLLLLPAVDDEEKGWASEDSGIEENPVDTAGKACEDCRDIAIGVDDGSYDDDDACGESKFEPMEPEITDIRLAVLGGRLGGVGGGSGDLNAGAAGGLLFLIPSSSSLMIADSEVESEFDELLDDCRGINGDDAEAGDDEGEIIEPARVRVMI